ncbi:MAG: S8 family serine peptidase [Rubrivivax sp.]|nr:S8 family serine peptidase [Rubrivivax sp.]
MPLPERLSWRLLTLLPLLLAALADPARAQASRVAQPDLGPVEGEVIVGWRAGAEALRRHPLPARAPADEVRRTLAARATLAGARAGRALEDGGAVGPRAQLLRARGESAQTLAARLAADPDVEFAVPNGRQRVFAAPNDPLYPQALRANGPDSGQWYLRAPTAEVVSSIDIERAWARTRGSPQVVVAVLDTGVRFEHPDLGRVADGGQLLPGHDFVSNATVANDGNGWDADPSDPGAWVSSSEAGRSPFNNCGASSSSWHGTATASLVGAAADNGIGMAGAAPGVRVLPVRVLGKCYGTDADITAGMRWAAGISVPGVPDNPTPAKVINMSLGSGAACSAAYQAAVDEITARGVLIVAAAGNSAGGPVGTPASCRGVLAVLALRHAGSKVGFSDLGPEIGIAAPGGNCINIRAGTPCLYPILAATNTGTQGPLLNTWTDSYDITVGTSFASPLVAAVAALMASVQPALTPAQLRGAMQSTARPFPTSGADNGPDDPTPVPSCTRVDLAGPSGQCYCTTGLCGAGMMDAGAAVAAVAGALARIERTTAAAVAGIPVAFSAANSFAASGATVTAWQWVLVDGGGIVVGFDSATNAPTATLTPSAAGRFTLRLTITDSLGNDASETLTVDVSATAPPPPSTGSGGGGGAFAPGWLLALAAAVAVLRRGRAAHGLR